MAVEITKLTKPDTTVEDRAAPDRAVLVVYEGDGLGSTTRVIELPDGAQLTVGRSRAASVSIDSERVSRIHARFSREGAELRVEDNGSRNGTRVNGVVVHRPHLLASGDEVEIGSATIVVSITSRVLTRPRIEGTRDLEQRLAAEVDRGQRFRRTFGLVMVRLDGSADLDAAIDRIAAELHPMDTLAEYSASEFALVLPELDSAGLREAAEQLATAARTSAGELVWGLKLAIGIAAFPEHGTTTDALIARARAAAEAAERLGDQEIGTPPADLPPFGTGVIIGDPQMRRVYELATRVAGHPITVLISGETGTGKEVVASAIHHASKRRERPLVSLNCASLPETLLESELFGHERGAFSGADRRKLGYFEAATGGSLFLDEIGELSAAMQAKLLRVLEQRTITRVGGVDEIEVDVRVLCATHRDLEAEVNRGAFRSDLFFRISGFTILIPPLRDRPDEILLFAEHFIKKVCTETRRKVPALAPSAANALCRYAWPGNVRELRNAIERAIVLHSRGVIEIEDLPDRVRDTRGKEAGEIDWQRDVADRMAGVERSAIVAALEACGDNQTEAAKMLGLSRRTLIYRMEKHGLKPPPTSSRK